jgi:hypothetical protein
VPQEAMHGRTRMSLQIRLGSGLQRERHGPQKGQPTPKRGMAERCTGGLCERSLVWLVQDGRLSRMKDRSSISVRDRLSQRLVLVDYPAAVGGDLEGSVTFMRQDKSQGSQSTRIRIERM